MARTFNGISDAYTAPIDLSATNKLTFCCWVAWTTFSDNDSLLCEFTSNYLFNDGGWACFPDSAAYAGHASAGFHSQAYPEENAYGGVRFARPSTGDWHHWAFVIDKTQPDVQKVGPVYIDGLSVPVDYPNSTPATDNFASDTLYIMQRQDGSRASAGSLQDLAVWSDVLTSDQISSIAAGSVPGTMATVTPLSVRPDALALYLPFSEAAIGITASLVGP